MAHRDMVPPRYRAFLSGELTAADLDDEEIRRGQLRDKNGTFAGRPSNVIPREFHEAIAKEALDRMNGRLSRMVSLSVDVLTEIALNKRAPAVARNQAAIYLLERVVGKIPDKVQQEVVMKKFENDLEEIVEDG
jgi:hypothetical protein